jgi:hypothetical protein
LLVNTDAFTADRKHGTAALCQFWFINFFSFSDMFSSRFQGTGTVCKDLQVGAISRKDKMKTICPVSNMNEKHMYISKHGHRSFYQIWYENTSCQLQYIVLFAGSQ